MLCELQRSVQRLADLIQQVMSSSGQEKISEAQQLVDKLEKEISQLRKKDSDLKELVTCQDNIYFLKVHKQTYTWSVKKKKHGKSRVGSLVHFTSGHLFLS